MPLSCPSFSSCVRGMCSCLEIVMLLLSLVGQSHLSSFSSLFYHRSALHSLPGLSPGEQRCGQSAPTCRQRAQRRCCCSRSTLGQTLTYKLTVTLWVSILRWCHSGLWGHGEHPEILFISGASTHRWWAAPHLGLPALSTIKKIKIKKSCFDKKFEKVHCFFQPRNGAEEVFYP